MTSALLKRVAALEAGVEDIDAGYRNLAAALKCYSRGEIYRGSRQGASAALVEAIRALEAAPAAYQLLPGESNQKR